MSFETIQPAFTTGEISPALYARVDISRYQTALRTCRNFIVRPYGGVQNRPGTMFVGEVGDSDKTVRLLPFEVSDADNYVIEVGDGYMRFISDGGYISAAGAAAWSAVTTYAANDFVTYSGTVYRALQSTLNDQPDVSPSDWVADSVYRITSPYTEAQLPNLKFTQSADVMTICHPEVRQQELRRLTATTFEIRDFENEEGPFQDQNADFQKQIYASAETGSITITALNATFTADDVGRIIRIDDSPYGIESMWEADKGYSGLAQVRVDDRIYQAQAGGTSGSVRPTHTEGARIDGKNGGNGIYWLYLHSGFGLAEITAFNSTTSVDAVVVKRLPTGVVGGPTAPSVGPWNHTGDGATTVFSIAVPNATQTFEAYYVVTVDGQLMEPFSDYTTNSVADEITFARAPANGAAIVITQYDEVRWTSKWSLSAWSDALGYPRAVAYFGDRLVFGGSLSDPQDLNMSRVADYTNFGTSNPVLDDDAITETLNSRRLNQIRDIVPLSKLLILTSSGEWVTLGGQDNVITPETVSFTQQSYFGTSTLQSRIIGNSAVYVQNGGRVVRDLGYVFEQDSYTGSDLTLLASHLTRFNTLTDMDFQALPYSAVWFVRDDGVLLSLTYVKDQEVIGWARHDTDGEFENVAVIPEGNEEAAYFVVKRTIDGVTKRYVERMAAREQEDIRDAYFVDCGLSYDGRNTGATTVTLTGGVTWEEGETFTLTASGATFALTDVDDYVFLYDSDGNLALQLLVTGFTSNLIVSVTSVGDVAAAYRSTATTAWALARNVFTGLDHLEGKEVAILADGSVVSNGDGDPSYEVTSGSVTIPNHAAVVHIGLPYVCDLETLDVTLTGGEVVRTRPKAIPRVNLIVESSRGVLIGPDENNLYEHKPREFEAYYDPTSPVTGLIEVDTATAFDRNGRILIRQNQPLPLAVLGVIPLMEVGGT